MTPLQIAATGLAAQQQRVDVVANNLANINTSGYQARRAEFTNLIFSNRDRPDQRESRAPQETPGGLQIGFGVQLADTSRIVEAGNLRQTGNDFDFAIQGDGYFEVTLPDGQPAYTRAGSFQLAQDGTIVTNEGLQLAPGINVPPNVTEISVNGSGEVLGALPGQDALLNLGQISLVRFPNEGGLRSLGSNLFGETTASGAGLPSVPGQEGTGTIVQGFVETSNVNPVKEIAQMIKAMRAYQINAQVVQTADQMMGPPPGG